MKFLLQSVNGQWQCIVVYGRESREACEGTGGGALFIPRVFICHPSKERRAVAYSSGHAPVESSLAEQRWIEGTLDFFALGFREVGDAEWVGKTGPPDAVEGQSGLATRLGLGGEGFGLLETMCKFSLEIAVRGKAYAQSTKSF